MHQINVTKTYLPPLEEYTAYLQGIWERGHLTNHGPLLQELEEKLKKHLGVKHLFVVNNGTIALQIAIKALELKNEIITTPFSYVATTSSIAWESCTPVFADIDPKTLCINPNEIKKKITPSTTGILATHVYGIPCNVEAIKEVAKQNNLKVIYDAAHAFGVNYKGTSVLNYGDISTLSFHATKLFHTIEGGAIITNDDELAHKISYMRNFGHNGPEAFFGAGINGKTSEFNAAMGLCILPKVPELIEARKRISELYDDILKNTSLEKPKLPEGTEYNYAYYPVLFKSESQLLEARKKLNDNLIFPRRYFYPSLNTLNYVGSQSAVVSEEASKKVLCLPLYYDLENEDVKRVAEILSVANQ
jgi:dTDP-4-amino-4,6-dideoxygalactose transaminase